MCVVGLYVFMGCDSVCCALCVLGVCVPACIFVCGLEGCVCLCGEDPEVGICLRVDKVE